MAWFNLCVAYLKLGQKEKAAEAQRQVEKIDPQLAKKLAE
jgi:hypothetical protein